MLFTLSALLLGMWSLSFYASSELRMDMQRLLGEQQLATAALLAAKVDQALNDRLGALDIVAKRITPAILSNPLALQTLLDERHLLQNMFNDGVAAFGVNGTPLASVPQPIGWQDDYDMTVFSAVIRERKARISRPSMSRHRQAPIFTISVPIQDPHGAVIGTLAGATSLGLPNFMDNVFDETAPQTGGYYILVAPQYRLIVNATDKNRRLQYLPPPGSNALIDRFVQGYEGTGITVNPAGMEVLASNKNIPVAGWQVGVGLPTAKAFAPVYAMQQRMLQATIFLTLLVGLLAWWLLQSLLEPILVATRALAKQTDANQPPQPLPIRSQDEIGQLIGAFNHLLETLQQREIDLREMAASLEDQVNTRTQQLRTISAQLTMTEERERSLLAQELHDNLGQLLAVIKIKLSTLKTKSTSLQLAIESITKLVDHADQSVRHITQQWSPPQLKILGFVPALEWLGEDIRRAYGIAVQIDIKACPRPLLDATQALLFRSVRELLINVARHAKVNTVQLSLCCDGNSMLITVRDSGCGFDPAQTMAALPERLTFGLHSIHERILTLGGTMNIDSSPGNGTTIALSVPCATVSCPTVATIERLQS